jgi:hypothetical protein
MRFLLQGEGMGEERVGLAEPGFSVVEQSK